MLLEQLLLNIAEIEEYSNAFFDKIEATVDSPAGYFTEVQKQYQLLDQFLKTIDDFLEGNPLQSVSSVPLQSHNEGEQTDIKMSILDEPIEDDSMINQRRITNSAKLCKQRLEEIMKSL